MAGDNDGLGVMLETSEPPLRVIAGLTGIQSLRSARPSAMGRVPRPLPADESADASTRVRGVVRVP